MFDSEKLHSHCREIVTSMWYPSNISASDRKTEFGDFFPTIELDDKLDYNPKDSISEAADKFADYYGFGEIQLLELKEYLTQSFYDSDYLPEKFPLVIYIPGMNGFSFDNHLLCEEIAKSGNVVISFNSKGTTKRWMEPNTYDYENQIRDVQYLIGMSYNLSIVDNSKISLIGHSVGGYVNILTKIRDRRITSLVSLDGSMIHDLARNKEFTYSDLKKVNCPFLSISPKDLGKAKVYLDSMVYADRYYYQVSSFGHSDFKSSSYFLKSKLNSEEFTNYQMLNNLIVSFINQSNENNESFKGFAEVDYLPSDLDFEDFKSEAYRSNFIDLEGIFNQLLATYPSFRITADDLYGWGNDLRYYGHLNQAIEVYELLIALYPDNMSGYKGSARTYLLQNKKDEAIHAYKQAIERQPDNESMKRKLNTLTTVESN